MGSASDTARRAVAYVRVSMMHEDGISPDIQIASISDWCGQHGYELTRVIEDLDLSGRFWRTRHIDDAIALIEAGEVQALVVWRWSRVSRDRYDWALALARVESVGGLLISATEDFDTTTSVGRFVRGVLMEFAAFESDRMGDLWREVARRRVRMGLPCNGRPMLGYRKQPDGSYLPDRRTARLLTESYQRYVDGQSFREIAAWLRRQRVRAATGGRYGGPTSSLIGEHELARALDGGFGAGLVRLKGEVFAGQQRPVVSPELWTRYQAVRSARRAKPRDPTLRGDEFAGLVRCGHCGRQMYFSHQPGEADRYTCIAHRKHGTALRSYRMDRLEGLLYRWVSALAEDPRRRAAARRDSADYAAKATRRAAELARAISRDPSNATLRADLVSARQAASWQDPAATAAVLAEQWRTVPADLRRELLGQLLTSVSLHRGHAEPYAGLRIATAWGTRTRWQGTTRLPVRIGTDDGIRWLQAAEAGQLVKISRQQVRWWHERGALPLTRTEGRRHFYASTDLERIKCHRLPHACVRYDINSVLEDLAAPAADQRDGIGVRWLRPVQAADKLGVSTGTLWQWNAVGALPLTRSLPKCNLYADTDLQRMRRHRRVDARGAWVDIHAVLAELEQSPLATSGSRNQPATRAHEPASFAGAVRS